MNDWLSVVTFLFSNDKLVPVTSAPGKMSVAQGSQAMRCENIAHKLSIAK